MSKTTSMLSWVYSLVSGAIENTSVNKQESFK